MKYIGNIQAFAALEKIVDGKGIITTNSAGAIYDAFGETEFNGISIPRGTIFTTEEEVIDAYKKELITIKKYHVVAVKTELKNNFVIVTRHKATEELLKEKFPGAEVLGGFVTPEAITNKVVIGVIPNELAAVAKSVANFVIPGFNYQVDADMTKEEIKERGGFLTEFVSVEEVK